MDRRDQIRRAEAFRALHHDPKLLVLPNIWDPLGARLLENLGYPAVATASAAVACSLGYADGERIRFAAMLDVIGSIAGAVEVPLTADVERGYADGPQEVADNVRAVLRAGAVGVNLEDSLHEGGPLRAVGEQVDRIRAVREMTGREALPLVINARIDTFLRRDATSKADRLAETIERGRAYLAAGADCLYPIGVGDIPTLAAIRAGTDAPINVYAAAATAPMRELEAAGVSRLSLGPNLLKAGLATMKKVAVELLNYGSYAVFTDGAIASDELEGYVRHHPMP